MTDRERDLLAAMAAQDGFRTVSVLRYYHPGLQQYSKHQLFHSAGVLVKLGLADRVTRGPERETRYKISEAGLAVVRSETVTQP